MRLLIVFVMALLLTQTAIAQKPFVSGIDKTVGTVNEEVTISGLNFPTGADLEVRFGASAAANIVSSEASLIVATVPSGATYAPITITNKNTGLTGYSSSHFLLSFAGSTFDEAKIGPQQVFQNGVSTQPFDLTEDDFDGDGWVDIIMTNEAGNKVDIYKNDMNNTAISFIPSTLATPGNLPTRNAESGDIDGDGLPDLVVTQGNNGNSMFIFRNTSTVGTISFGAALIITLPNLGENIRIARRPILSDLDGDGKPEIVVSNQSDNILHVYTNTSIGPENVTFSGPTELVATGSTVGISGLDVRDLNNDGFPEVVASPFITSPNLFVFRNTSSPGNLSIEAATILTAPSGIINTIIGDFDGDGWNDVASTSVSTNSVLFFRNLTDQIGQSISLASPISIATNTVAPLGLGLGDLNGDGKVDLVVGHEAGTNSRLVALINTTAGTDFTFSTANISSISTSRNVKIADLNNDGRPDIAYTNNITTGAAGDLSVFKNNNCVVPTVTPIGPLVICTGTALTLKTNLTESPMTYSWLDGGTPIGGATNSTFSVLSGGSYTVTISDGDGCTVTSAAAVVVTVDPAMDVTPLITSPTVSCQSLDFTLSTSTDAAGYQWSGPGGFTSTEQNPTITSMQASQAGTYSLRVEIAPNSCLSSETTTEVTVQNLPQPVVINTNGENFCQGNTVNITTPNYTGFTYSWNRNGTAIVGETTTTLSVTTSGSYTSLISDGTCTLESPAESLTAVAPPVASYTSVDAICIDLPINFVATSTGESGFTLANNWAFNDAAGSTANIAEPIFTYTAAGSFNATLTTSYEEIENCSNTSQKSITVQAVPVIIVEAQDASGTALISPFEKCPSDNVTLSVPSTLNDVTWTVSGQTDVLSSESAYSTSEVDTYSVSGTDLVGCAITSEVALNNFEGSGLVLTSSSTIDTEDVITLEDGQTSVDLTVTGGSTYSWVPAELVSDPTGSMIEVFPFEISTVLTVTGMDINNCVETAMVTIVDPFITPRKSFSPNGDNLGDECWEITNSSTLNGCNVIVFDSRGRRLLEVESPFDQDCVWDGNFSGNPVPEGVYYYAMSCEDNRFNSSGSILLAR